MERVMTESHKQEFSKTAGSQGGEERLPVIDSPRLEEDYLDLKENMERKPWRTGGMNVAILGLYLVATGVLATGVIFLWWWFSRRT
jgi:hypothetical protein